MSGVVQRTEPDGMARRMVLRWVVIVGPAVIAAVVAASVRLGSPSTDDRPDTPMGMSEEKAVAPARLDVDEFATRLAVRDVVVINVHTPYEGEIEGTDLFVPYDRISEDPAVPSNRAAPIALYCRSGRMSHQAAQTLAAEGYTNVVDLDGGMAAWEAADRPLLSRRDPEVPGMEEANQPSSLRRPGEGTGASNPGGFVALGLLVVGWGVGFGIILRRARRTNQLASPPSS
jgi:rhodanese-related sulfurtransferase